MTSSNVCSLALQATHDVTVFSRIALAANKTAVSSVFIRDVSMTFAINLNPGSNDINFFLKADAGYSYVAVGIGSVMKDSLMLIAYAAADGRRKFRHRHGNLMAPSDVVPDITISPRLGS
jgi:hypothetical protein